MRISLGANKLALMAMLLLICVACSEVETVTKIEQSQNEVTLDTKVSSTDVEKNETINPWSIPPKPPIPEGVKVAIDCQPIAARYDEHWKFLLERGWCGHQKPDGSLHIDKEVVDLLDFTHPAPAWRRHSKNLKCLSIWLSNETGGFAYVRSDGRSRFANYPYDNECQPFGNGVFVQYLEGFAVYTNENFDPVKKTNYVLADGFYNHLSKVCRVKPEKQYDIHGEHFEWIGGQCGYVGTDFKVVEPVIHAYEDTPRPTGGKYDGDDPTGIEARMVEALKLNLPNSKYFETVFLKDGCNFQSDFTQDNCDKNYSGLPKELYKKGNSIREFHLRLEDQSYFRGLVIYNGAPGFHEWEREIYWHHLEPIQGTSSE